MVNKITVFLWKMSLAWWFVCTFSRSPLSWMVLYGHFRSSNVFLLCTSEKRLVVVLRGAKSLFNKLSTFKIYKWFWGKCVHCCLFQLAKEKYQMEPKLLTKMWFLDVELFRLHVTEKSYGNKKCIFWRPVGISSNFCTGLRSNQGSTSQK